MIDRLLVAALAIALAIALVSCVSYALAPEDAQSLRDVQAMSAYSYSFRGATNPAAQFDRAAYCAANAVLTRHDAGTVDAGIVCSR
jgi:hypothetical protein